MAPSAASTMLVHPFPGSACMRLHVAPSSKLRQTPEFWSVDESSYPAA